MLNNKTMKEFRIPAALNLFLHKALNKKNIIRSSSTSATKFLLAPVERKDKMINARENKYLMIVVIVFFIE